jgi:hypothetical protein
MPTPEEIKAANAKPMRTPASIRRHPLVRDISDERANGDGFWIYLKNGWVCSNSECNAVSEDTLEEAVACLRRVYFDEATKD